MKYILPLILCIYPFFSKAQLYATVETNIPTLVYQYLATNTTISNIQYTGVISAIGKFDASYTFLGLNQGVIMTTGTILNTGDGPQGPNNSSGSGIDNGATGSTILNNILSSNNTYNAAQLEFDFIANSDNFFMNYIFGAEEYDAYVNAGFNDVFGIFISGSGIAGYKNIALLPNQLPVCVDNINAGTYPTLYTNNGNGSESPFSENAQYIAYNGYTHLLQASHATFLDSTYHLKIAIADVGDGILDAGVFLSANSLGFTGIVENQTNNSELAFPNPTSGMIHLKNKAKIQSIEVLDALGRKVKTISHFETKAEIDISELANGLYTLIITSKSGREVQQIQLMK